MTGYALAIVIGFICGVALMGAGTDRLTERRIEAGAFEFGGIAYIVKPMSGE